jgi:hypothetical protein
MFVGYATDHAVDGYYMWNPKTNGVHVTRDIVWLKRMFYPVPACRELTSIVNPMTNIEVKEGVEVEEGVNEDSDSDYSEDSDEPSRLQILPINQLVHIVVYLLLVIVMRHGVLQGVQVVLCKRQQQPEALQVLIISMH